MAYLEHHGIPNMKWGVRRYQNPDGSLTELGKKRYRQYIEADKKATAYSLSGDMTSPRAVVADWVSLKRGNTVHQKIAPKIDRDAYRKSVLGDTGYEEYKKARKKLEEVDPIVRSDTKLQRKVAEELESERLKKFNEHLPNSMRRKKDEKHVEEIIEQIQKHGTDTAFGERAYAEVVKSNPEYKKADAYFKQCLDKFGDLPYSWLLYYDD